MHSEGLDYDRIAPTYNRRYVVNDMQATLRALQELARFVGARNAIEISCGTAHWLEALSTTVPFLVGLDPSTDMLAQAGTRQVDLLLVRGVAERLPFPAASFDLLFALNAIHHFTHKRDFIAEAFRLLRSGGALAVIGSNPSSPADSWYIYNYFSGTYQRDLARFPTLDELHAWMSDTGFERLEHHTVEHFHNIYHGRAVLDDPFLARDSTSQLALLSDQEYAQDLERIQRDIQAAESSGSQLLFLSDLHIHMLTGWKA